MTLARKFPGILAWLNDPCVYCGEPAMAFDHITPKHRGGRTEWENLAPACATCNPSKRTASLLGFLLVKNHLQPRFDVLKEEIGLCRSL